MESIPNNAYKSVDKLTGANLLAFQVRTNNPNYYTSYGSQCAASVRELPSNPGIYMVIIDKRVPIKGEIVFPWLYNKPYLTEGWVETYVHATL